MFFFLPESGPGVVFAVRSKRGFLSEHVDREAGGQVERKGHRVFHGAQQVTELHRVKAAPGRLPVGGAQVHGGVLLNERCCVGGVIVIVHAMIATSLTLLVVFFGGKLLKDNILGTSCTALRFKSKVWFHAAVCEGWRELMTANSAVDRWANISRVDVYLLERRTASCLYYQQMDGAAACRLDQSAVTIN